jgi:hypothetical protein
MKKMKLEPDHEMMLAREAGKVLASAMRTLVEYGKAFGAKRMVPIKSSHLAETFGTKFFKAYLHISGPVLAEIWFGKGIPVVEYSAEDIYDKISDEDWVEVNGETGEIKIRGKGDISSGSR